MASTSNKRLKAAQKARRKAAKADRKRGPVRAVYQLNDREFALWKEGKRV